MRDLVDRFSRHVRRLATAILDDGHLAEDAVQEAFLTALSRLSQLREPRSFAAWLRQIVRSEANRISRRRRERPGEEAGAAREDGATASDPLEREELRASVRRALEMLPPKGREAVELFYLEDLSHREIALRLDVPRGTVRRRLHDARERLRSMLLGYIREGRPPERPKAPPEPRLPL